MDFYDPGTDTSVINGFLGDYSAPPQNNELGPVFTNQPIVDAPSDSPSTQLVTNNAFNINNYPVNPTPGATGGNTVSISGYTYVVTPDNYSTLARMYIDWRNSVGDTQYNSATYQGQQSIIGVANAFRQLANLPTTTQVIDPNTGQLTNPVLSTSNAVLTNPLVTTSDAVSNAGSKIFKGGASLITGAANTVGQLGNFSGVVGNLFSNVGGLIVIGIVGFLLYRKLK